MKARMTILTSTAVLALSGPAAQLAGASIPWDTKSSSSSVTRTLQSGGGCVSQEQQPTRTLAFVRTGYDWRDYVANAAGGYDPAAYVHGGAPLIVAKAIVAAGKYGGTTRATQSGKRSTPSFHYAR